MVAGNPPATIAAKDEAPGKYHQQKQKVLLPQIQCQIFSGFQEVGKKWTQVHWSLWKEQIARSTQACFVHSITLKDVSRSKE